MDRSLKKRLVTGAVAVAAAASLIGVGLGIGSVILPDRVVVVNVAEAITVSPDSIVLEGVHPNETHEVVFDFINAGTENITIEWTATVTPPVDGSPNDLLVVYEPTVVVPAGESTWSVFVTLANHVLVGDYTVTVSPVRAYIALGP